jgi:hypothetical protein
VIELTIVVVEVEMPLTKGNISQLQYPSTWIEIQKVNMVCQGFVVSHLDSPKFLASQFELLSGGSK